MSITFRLNSYNVEDVEAYSSRLTL